MAPAKGVFLTEDQVHLLRAAKRGCEQAATFYERLAALIERGREKADEAAELYERILDELPIELVDKPRRRRPWFRSREEKSVLKAESVAGVSSVSLAFNDDGSGMAQINGRSEFRLQHQVAVLLSVLVTTTTAGPDGFPPWRTAAEIAVLMEKRGEPVSPGYVVRLICKLRAAMQAAGENRYLIRHGDFGYRVAVRV